VLPVPKGLRVEWIEARALMEVRWTVDEIVPVCEVGRVVWWSKVVYCGLAIAEESSRTLYYRRKGAFRVIYVVSGDGDDD
jgi:hypothetical protein